MYFYPLLIPVLPRVMDFKIRCMSATKPLLSTYFFKHWWESNSCHSVRQVIISPSGLTPLLMQGTVISVQKHVHVGGVWLRLRHTLEHTTIRVRVANKLYRTLRYLRFLHYGEFSIRPWSVKCKEWLVGSKGPFACCVKVCVCIFEINRSNDNKMQMERMGYIPIFCVNVRITIGIMLKFDANADADGNIDIQ